MTRKLRMDGIFVLFIPQYNVYMQQIVAQHVQINI